MKTSIAACLPETHSYAIQGQYEMERARKPSYSCITCVVVGFNLVLDTFVLVDGRSYHDNRCRNLVFYLWNLFI